MASNIVFYRWRPIRGKRGIEFEASSSILDQFQRRLAALFIKPNMFRFSCTNNPEATLKELWNVMLISSCHNFFIGDGQHYSGKVILSLETRTLACLVRRKSKSAIDCGFKRWMQRIDEVPVLMFGSLMPF